jgi:hypothetical protein
MTMKKLIAKLSLVVAVAALAGCSTYQNVVPAWMPGSGAIKVNLTGQEEVPPLSVPGSGSGSLRVAEDGTVSGSVTTKDVAGTMAHIHRGAKGANGPVIVPLDKNGDTYSVPAGRKLTADQLKDLKAGNLYVNVHTAKNKGGEVRGQLNP